MRILTTTNTALRLLWAVVVCTTLTALYAVGMPGVADAVPATPTSWYRVSDDLIGEAVSLHPEFGPDGTIWVAQTTNAPWSGAAEFNIDGSPTGRAFGVPSASSVAITDTHVYVVDASTALVSRFALSGPGFTSFGGLGSGNGDLDRPCDIAIHEGTDRVYVLDGDNHRIQAFDLAGNYLFQWGSLGSGAGNFAFSDQVAGNPCAGPAIDVEGSRVYVLDNGNGRVQVFDLDGNFVREFGEFGTNSGQFDRPVDLDVENGSVFVADHDENQVQELTTTGTYIRVIPVSFVRTILVDEAGDTLWADIDGLGGNYLYSYTERRCDNEKVTIIGSSYADTITGTGGVDVVDSAAGNDKIVLDDGDDLACGGTGKDVIKGGPGTDAIFGEGGADKLKGGADNDSIIGGPGNDRIAGSLGNDYIEGNDGNDELKGKNGLDELFGGLGNDTVFGGNGADFANGGAGDDTVIGGAKGDTLNGNNGDDDIRGGGGNDTMNGGGDTDVCNGNAGTDTATNCELAPNVP